MQFLSGIFAKYPELAVYLALSLGFWWGSIKIRGFNLGGVTGALLAGILVGVLFDVHLPGSAKSLVFLLFLFGIGYQVGPQFITAMRSSGWRLAVLGVFMPVVGLLTAWLVAKYLGLSPGYSAGMMSGALTQSPAMGTAVEAIEALQVDEGLKKIWAAQVGVADAICYLGGALGVILFCSTIGPRLLGVNLREEALRLEAEQGIKRTSAGLSSAWQPFEFRAYRLTAQAAIVGLTVAVAEQRLPGLRLFIERIRRGDQILAALPATILMADDVVLVSGRHEVLVQILGDRAEEVDDRELQDVSVASYQIFITASTMIGRPLEEIANDDAVRGVFLRRLVRHGNELPIGTRTTFERGDVVHVVGSEAAVIRAGARLGEVVAPVDTTDFVAVGGAIFLGAAIGAAASFDLKGVPVSIGTSVGVLLAGIITGYVRSRRPLFGRVPDAAVKFMQSFGLAAFVAIVGINAGPHFMSGIREAGLGMLLGGLIITAMPLVAGLYFGRYVLGINPLILLGAVTGAQTFTAGLAVVQEKSGSPIAVIGYSGAVAVAQILLTLWGTVMVMLNFP